MFFLPIQRFVLSASPAGKKEGFLLPPCPFCGGRADSACFLSFDQVGNERRGMNILTLAAVARGMRHALRSPLENDRTRERKEGAIVHPGG